MGLAIVFLEGDTAESELIKSVLERHKVRYGVCNTIDPENLERMKRLCPNTEPPAVLIGRKTVWNAPDLPGMEASRSGTH